MTQSLQVIISLTCVGIIGIASYFYIATVLPKKKKKSNSDNERKEEKHNDLQNSEIAKENAIYEAGIGNADEKSDNSNPIKSDCINLIDQDDVLEKATQQVIDDVEKRSPPYIERVPKENVPNISDDDGCESKEDVYEFEDQVISSNDNLENEKCSNDYENVRETNDIPRSEECNTLCQKDADSQESLDESFSNHVSNGICDEEKQNTNIIPLENDHADDAIDVVVEGTSVLLDDKTIEEDVETIEDTRQQIARKHDGKEILTDDLNASENVTESENDLRKEEDYYIVDGSEHNIQKNNNEQNEKEMEDDSNKPEHFTDLPYNSNIDEDSFIISGSISIDQKIVNKHTEEERDDNVNTDSHELNSTSNEEEAEGSYSLLGDIKDTNDLTEREEPLLKPMTNIDKDKDKSFISNLQEDYSEKEKNVMTEEASAVDDDSSSSNSDKSPMSSSTHVSTFGVWDVQPVLNNEIEEEEELVSSEKEENTNIEQRRGKKRRSKKK